jgi:chloramphenicol O-acetyltransferase type B
MTSIRYRLARLFGKKRPVTLQERYPQYRIGRHSYGDLKVRSWGEGTLLEVGAFCSFASGVKVFLGGEHRVDWVTSFPFPELWKELAGHFPGHPHSKGDVVIGNDVWFGTEAIIMSGVRIGDGAVVGARAVVTRDVPPYAIVAGSPARLVRFRFEPSIIDRLVSLAWWHWDDQRIGKLLPLLLSANVEAFIAAADEYDPSA